MSNLTLAIEQIEVAIAYLGAELGTLVHNIGIDSPPTADLAHQINVLAEAAKALGNISGLNS